MSWCKKISEAIRLLKLKNEYGSILVVTALAIPTILGLLGFAFDVGNLYMHKARLQNVADAAALAAAKVYLHEEGATRDIHPLADAEAEAYIARNRINLPNEINHDFNSLRVRIGEKNNKPYYRVGLYENVPLYFLPVISGISKTQKVRAEAIVVAEEGTPGSSASGITVNPNSSFNIFDNLFAFSEYFRMEDAVNQSPYQTNASIKGKIAYSHFNRLDDGSYNEGTLIFYKTNGSGGNHDEDSNHLYSDKTSLEEGADKNVTKINDPTINTFVHTSDYIKAFRERLYQLPHYDVLSEDDLVITGNPPSSGTRQSCCFTINDGGASGNQTWFLRNAGTYYYRMTSNSYSSHEYVTKNSKQYKVCYYPYPYNNWDGSKLVLCGQDQENLRFYLLKAAGSGYEVTDQYVGKRINNSNENYSFWDVDTNIPAGTDINSFIWRTESSFTNINSANQGGIVYHVSKKLRKLINTGANQNLNIKINGQITGNANGDPLYIMIEDDIESIYISGSGGNVRPIIIVYFGTGNIQVTSFTGDFTGTIYAPFANIAPVNFRGENQTFSGNIIGRRIDLEASNKSTWEWANHLSSDDYINNVADTAKNEALQSVASADLIDTLVTAFNGLTYKSNPWSSEEHTLSVTKDDIGNEKWYKSLPYAAKQALYVKWRGLYDNASAETRNLLWTWNGLLSVTEEGGQVEGTPDKIRLINPRVETDNPFTIYNIPIKMF